MGRRKINNAIMAVARKAAKVRRDQKRAKRIAKGQTAGQALAEKMNA